MSESEITVHSRPRLCGLCESMSVIGVDLESTNRNEFDNFICALCWRLAQLRKKAGQIEQASNMTK
jgi:hypothetical protein